MTLQYREDVDRLIVEGSSLANECCCPGCTDPVACHRFDACCDGTLFDDLLDHPHYVVISNDRYVALGSPACVVYNNCCYCNHSESEKGFNVDEANVTASVEVNCADCFGNEGSSCVTCNTCGSCDPQQPLSVIATISDVVSSSQAPGFNAELEKAHTLIYDGSTTGCRYIKTWTASGATYYVILDWATTNWRLIVQIIFLASLSRTYSRTSSADVQCNSIVGTYSYNQGGSAGFPSYAGVVSL